MKTIKSYILLTLIMLMATAASAASETGDTCSTNEDCPDLNYCQANICVHKELFPITFREVGGTFFILLLNAIMTAGGVGAGAAYVPYIMLIFQNTLKQSIYVAYACVFGGGVGNLINIITLKNPANKRYMINFDVNMIILPALMIGVITGVLISRMLPPFMTNLILLCVLGYSIFKNFYKLKANLAKEKKQRTIIKQEESDKIIQKETVPQEQEEQEYAKSPEKKEAIAFSLAQVEEDSPGSTLNSVPMVKTISIDPIGSPTEINTALTLKKKDSQNDLQAEKKELILQRELRFPFHKLRELLVNFVIIIVIGLIRGSKNFSPVVGVEWTCSWDFIWFGLGIFAFLLTLTRNVYLVQKWQKEKLEVGYEFLPQEPILDKRKTIKLVLGAIIAGIIGALVALGGSMIMGPILLDMNIPPAFSATTTGVFMIFSMFNATFSTILDGHLSWQELVWFLPLSFVFSYASSKIVNWYVKKTGKQSTIIKAVMLGAIMGLVCLLAIFINSLVENFSSQVQFQPLC